MGFVPFFASLGISGTGCGSPNLDLNLVGFLVLNGFSDKSFVLLFKLGLEAFRRNLWVGGWGHRRFQGPCPDKGGQRFSPTFGLFLKPLLLFRADPDLYCGLSHVLTVPQTAMCCQYLGHCAPACATRAYN